MLGLLAAGTCAGSAPLAVAALLLAALLLAAAWPAARPAALGLGLGLLLGSARAAEQARWPAAGHCLVEGTGTVLASEPRAPGGQRFELGLDGGEGCGARLEVRWDCEQAAGLAPGDRVRALLEVEARRAPRSPGERDQRSLLDRRGLWARARAEGDGAVVPLARGAGVARWLADVRAAAVATLSQRLPAIDAGLARALLLGDRGALARRDAEVFRSSGQGHLVAVSGQHVVLVLAAVMLLVRLVRLPQRARLCVGLLALLAYVPLAGAAPSAVRSGLTAGLWLLARLSGREGVALDVICATALAMLALDPGALQDVGFTLSFAAVLGIERLAPRLAAGLWAHATRVPGVLEPRRPRLRLALAVALAAWLAGAPLAQHAFGSLAPASAPLSLLAVPLAGALLGLAAGVLLLGGLPLVGEVPILLFGQVASLLRQVLGWPAQAGLGLLEGEPPGAAWLALALLLLLVACAGPARLLRWALLGLCALLLCALAPQRAAAPATPEAVALEAGRAQCVLVRLPDGRSLLLCSGGPALGPVLRWDLPDALRGLGIARLDLAWQAHDEGRLHPGIADLVARGRAARAQCGLAGEAACVLAQGAWGRLEAHRAGGRQVVDLCAGEARLRLLPGPPTPEGPQLLVAGPAGAGSWRAWPAPGAGAAQAEYPARAMLAPTPPDLGSLAWLAVALAAFAAACVRPLGWLDAGGAVAALVLGTACTAALGWPALAALLAPFVVATLLGKLPGRPREAGRTALQVACNGLPALLGAGLALAGLREAGAAVLVGSLACLGADTCATEVGTRYGGRPRALWGGRTLEPGESGGVTLAGLLASLLGACLAPLAFGLLAGLPLHEQAWLCGAGVAGGLLDSVLGATLQFRGRAPDGRVLEQRRLAGAPLPRVRGWRWLDNDAVNLATGLVAGLLAWALVAA
ncbi:MAG: ComEC/Rec2 family competence protein [Planctomycetia bacterium]